MSDIGAASAASQFSTRTAFQRTAPQQEAREANVQNNAAAQQNNTTRPALEATRPEAVQRSTETQPSNLLTSSGELFTNGSSESDANSRQSQTVSLDDGTSVTISADRGENGTQRSVEITDPQGNTTTLTSSSIALDNRNDPTEINRTSESSNVNSATTRNESGVSREVSISGSDGQDITLRSPGTVLDISI